MHAVASSAPATLFACIRAHRAPDLPWTIAKAFSPRVQRHGEGCAVFDVSGLGRLLGDAQAIGMEVQRACAAQSSRDVSVAVAPSQMAVLLLTFAHPALTVETGDPASALASVPLRVLRQLHVPQEPGTTAPGTRVPKVLAARAASYAKAFDVLDRWGLTTMGELAALPAGALSARLGQTGVALQRQAAGIDLQPLVPDPEVPRFLERVELEWPIDGLEPLSFVLARLLDPLSIALERADRGAAAISLDLRLTDRSRHTRMLQLPAAMRDPKVLRTLLVLDLESHPPSAAIDIVTIEVDPAPGRVLQYSLLERARPSAETLATLTARLAALVGESRSGQAALLDSHHPDAFEMRRFAPGDREIGGRRAGAGTVVLRRFRPPVAICVNVEEGRPIRVAIDRRGMPGGRVEQSAGPWRSSGAWWEAAAHRWNRDEWDVAFSDGCVCRLFRERDTGHWFLDGVVD
jgi:protein ImuB